MPIQQMLLGVGAATKTYVDDVFSTYLYEGNGSSQSINNGMDLSASGGGMVWIKGRGSSHGQEIFDTVRGALKDIRSDRNNAEETLANSLTAFNSNGFSVGSVTGVNQDDISHASWTFRKVPGFLDILEYQGTGSAKTVAHSLGSIPGLILIKATDSSENWRVYHKSLTATHHLVLNLENKANTGAAHFNDTNPTASVFSVGTDDAVNQNGKNFVAYVFAGGESDAATARSVEFDGSNDYLSIPDSADFNLGTSSFTIECWVYPDTGTVGGGYYGMICGQTNPAWYITVRGDGPDHMQYYDGTSAYNSAANSIPEGQWTHVAFVNNSGTGTWYINGVASTDGGVVSAPNIPNSSGAFEIGTNQSNYFNGKISNLRIVKGTAVYTSSFKPPTEPLTNITNTKLLCCNDSSQTGSTVTPGTITNNGSTASTDSPFDDPAAFTFGDGGDQSVISCGSYFGNTQTDGPHVYLGWEPQYLLIKNAGTDSTPWQVWDSMRGVVTGGNDEFLSPNNTDSTASYERISFTPTGFKLDANSSYVNESGKRLIYIAIRRPDGYVGKPPELGTDVFGFAYGTGTTPAFAPGFPVDFTFLRRPDTTENWTAAARLIQGKYLHLNSNASENSDSNIVFDYNNGFHDGTGFSSYLSWSWKRHAGFDCICFKGNSANRQIAHSLNAVPQMIWVKQRSSSTNWEVYHSGLNGGSNPEQYRITLTDSAEVDDNTAWNDTAPTATHFSLGTNANVNNNDEDLIAFLFSSVTGISKVGVYAGSNSAQSITTGFQPRFLIIKNTANTDPWYVLDTTRGWGSGDDKRLYLNTDTAQSDQDVGAPTSTGFDLTGNVRNFNQAGRYYIYYAHA